jgi:HEAT repeat protein
MWPIALGLAAKPWFSEINRTHLLRLAAFTVAAGCGRDPLAPTLAKLMDRSPEVRRVAARELGKHPPSDSRAIVALSQSASDQDAEVRRLSAYALGAIGPGARSALPALEKALADGEGTVRIAAALAIQHIEPTDKAFQPVLLKAIREGNGRVIREVGGMKEDGAWAVPSLASCFHTRPGRCGRSRRSRWAGLVSRLETHVQRWSVPRMIRIPPSKMPPGRR